MPPSFIDGELQSVNHHSHLSHDEFGHNGGFDAEQSAMLDDGEDSMSYAHVYSQPNTGTEGVRLNNYGDGVSGSTHSNGVVPAFDFAYNAEHTYSHLVEEPSLSPVALLESLSSYEHPPTTSNVPISNDHFASLLRAAATAGEHVGSSPSRRITRQAHALEQISSIENRSFLATTQSNNTSEPTFVTTSTRRKRQEQTEEDSVDEEERLAREREIWGSEEEQEQDNIFDATLLSPIATSDVRALGVHSAAALFRQPSKASQNHTREPVGKVFASLHLSTPIFLHVQGAAKKFMLDPAHPERSECVGNRGKGDADMVKLKLFACVEEFVDHHGWGEKLFGANSYGAEKRRFHWPAMKNKIIALLTPILRRSVTNERQRLYALATRKAKKKAVTSRVVNRSPKRQIASVNDNQHQESSTIHPAIDPKLDNYHYSLDRPLSVPEEVASVSKELNGETSLPGISTNGSLSEESTLHYHVHILSNGTRIRPKLHLTPATCPGFPSLVQHVHKLLSDDAQHHLIRIQTLGLNGLVDVIDDETWTVAVKAAEENVWMEGELKVVVDVHYTPNDGSQ